jgi:hypothetical protein
MFLYAKLSSDANVVFVTELQLQATGVASIVSKATNNDLLNDYVKVLQEALKPFLA